MSLNSLKLTGIERDQIYWRSSTITKKTKSRFHAVDTTAYRRQDSQGELAEVVDVNVKVVSDH